MAKSFKEIGKKAEELIEQGRVAEHNVQRCQAGVAAADRRVSAARQALENASISDEEGNPTGDVEQARAALNVAESQLAYSRQRLAAARSEADRVRQEKSAHVRAIENHNQTERSNLQKLRRLQENAFAADSTALTEGMAQRLNEAEDTRVELLRSMGIDATADHVAVDSGRTTEMRWNGGGFANLDLSGIEQSIHGRGSENNTKSGIATPIGGALNSFDGDGYSNNMVPDNSIAYSVQDDMQKEVASSFHDKQDVENDGFKDICNDMIRSTIIDNSLTGKEQLRRLDYIRQEIYNAYFNVDQIEAEAIKNLVKQKVLTPEEKRQMGEQYITNILNVYRDNLLDKGVVSVSALDSTINELRRFYSAELEKDLLGQPNRLYEDPDYDSLIETIKRHRPAIATVVPGDEMSFDLADSGHVNPNIGKGYGYSINCQSCVVAFEARERGYDVQVLPNTTGSMLEQLSRNTNMAWIDPRTGKHPDYIFDNTRRTPEEYLEFINQVVKPGERYTIQFAWKGPGHYGHIVNLDRTKDGLLRIKDNQRKTSERSQWIGDVGVLDYLHKMKYEDRSLFSKPTPCVPQLLRIDNMDFDFSVVNCIMKGADYATRRG